MARSTQVYGEWAQHDGRTVTVGGLKCRLRCNVFMARYPVAQEMISVHAEPISRTSKAYRETRAALGDDWSTDVLDSDIELQSEILAQLGA